MEGKALLPFLMIIFIGMEFNGSATAVSVTYYQTKISKAKLTQANVAEVVNVKTATLCAIRANFRSWCHLFCFENQLCQMYDLPFHRYLEDGTADAVNCSTNVQGCIKDGNVYPEGENLTKPCEIPEVCNNRSWQALSGCLQACQFHSEGDTIVNTFGSSIVCQNQSWEYIQVGTVNWDTDITGIGNIYIHFVSMTFDAANDYCLTHGAQLLVSASDTTYNAVNSYLNSVDGSAKYWVGVRDQKWLDGSDVPQGSFDDAVTYCGYLHPTYGSVYDDPCSSAFYFVCQQK